MSSYYSRTASSTTTGRRAGHSGRRLRRRQANKTRSGSSLAGLYLNDTTARTRCPV